jgi:C1A family cysteine protease
MAVKKVARRVGQGMHIPLSIYEEEVRLADQARSRAQVLRRTTAAADVTRTRGRRSATRAAATRPTSGFDPRDGSGARLAGAVREQPSHDRMCVAHATAVAIESFISRKSASVAALPSLSVSHIFQLSGDQELLSPTARGVSEGVLESACFPPTPACANPALHAWRTAMTRLDAIDDPVAEMCAALRGGDLLVVSVPVFANFSDFVGSGVYSPGGQELGAHALCILGYDASAGGGSWIVQNSYGSSWGDAGCARVAWEDSDLQPERVTYRVQGVLAPGA